MLLCTNVVISFMEMPVKTVSESGRYIDITFDITFLRTVLWLAL